VLFLDLDFVASRGGMVGFFECDRVVGVARTGLGDWFRCSSTRLRLLCFFISFRWVGTTGKVDEVGRAGEIGVIGKVGGVVGAGGVDGVEVGGSVGVRLVWRLSRVCLLVVFTISVGKERKGQKGYVFLCLIHRIEGVGCVRFLTFLFDCISHFSFVYRMHDPPDWTIGIFGLVIFCYTWKVLRV
jgi:hypothetical protein